MIASKVAVFSEKKKVYWQHLVYLKLGARVVSDELLPALVLRVRGHERRPLAAPRRVSVLRLKVQLVVVDLRPQRAARLWSENNQDNVFFFYKDGEGTKMVGGWMEGTRVTGKGKKMGQKLLGIRCRAWGERRAHYRGAGRKGEECTRVMTANRKQKGKDSRDRMARTCTHNKPQGRGNPLNSAKEQQYTAGSENETEPLP